MRGFERIKNVIEDHPAYKWPAEGCVISLEKLSELAAYSLIWGIISAEILNLIFFRSSRFELLILFIIGIFDIITLIYLIVKRAEHSLIVKALLGTIAYAVIVPLILFLGSRG